MNTTLSSTRIIAFENTITRSNTYVPPGRVLKNHIPISDSKEHYLLLVIIPLDKLVTTSSTKLFGVQSIIIRDDISVLLDKILKVHTTISCGKKYGVLLQAVPPVQLNITFPEKN